MTGDLRLSAVVLDTNVVLDWLLFGDPSVAALAAAVEAGRVRWVISGPMRDELCHVAGRADFGRWKVDPPQMLLAVERLGRTTPAAAACSLRCSDDADQMFIDLALAERARWLVTRDRALLRLARPACALGTVICTPAHWSERVT